MNLDKSYYDICNNIASKSKCLSRKIGAILVKDGLIVASGYNGPPKVVPRCNIRHQKDIKLYSEYNSKLDPYFITREQEVKICPRQVLGFKSGQGLDWCVAVHAERSCLVNAAKDGISTAGTTLYMDCPTPCTPCLVEIIAAGVSEIVFTKLHYYDISSEYVLMNSPLKWRVYNFKYS